MPAKEDQKNTLAAAATALINQRVLAGGPTCQVPSGGTSDPPNTGITSRVPNSNRLSAHDANGSLLPCFVTGSRLDEVVHAMHAAHTATVMCMRVLTHACLLVQFFGKSEAARATAKAAADAAKAKARKVAAAAVEAEEADESEEEAQDDSDEEPLAALAKPKDNKAKKTPAQKRKKARDTESPEPKKQRGTAAGKENNRAKAPFNKPRQTQPK
jgi:hypothetical protein